MIPLSESSILVVGLARDCEKYLSGSIECLVKTFGAAKSIAFLIVESIALTIQSIFFLMKRQLD